MQYISKIILLLCGTMIVTHCHAKCILPTEITNAFKNGSPSLDFRLRQEDSKQQGLEAGYATTLRTTVGYETTEFYKFVFKVEVIDVAHFFGLHYNPGVSDLSRPQYTLIPDPPGAGLTAAKLTYNGFANNSLVFGRQYINLDNERFIGANDFRQYPQSFDAISLNSQMIRNFDIFYAYVIDVNTNAANGRAIAGQRQLSTNLLNVDWTGFKFGGLGGYVYLNNDHTTSTNSNTTFGVRLLSPEDLTQTDNYAYLFEIAWQTASFNNPVSYHASYLHCYFSKAMQIVTALVGFERLSGSSSGNNKVFITPLGSVDNFNGLAQAFATPPARGLQDAYATVNFSKYDITAGITYHLFRLDKGPGPQFAGQEFDLYANWQITQQIALNITYADYNAQNNAALSAKRFWVMLTAHLL